MRMPVNTMFGIHNYTSFIAAIVAFQIVPGPGTLVILSATARGGLCSGMGAVLGTLAGDFLFMVGAVLGLASVLSTRPMLLSSFQWAGIIYLCWLGVKLYRTPTGTKGKDPIETLNGWAQFRRAFLVCLTSPKAIMFFMAFFPLFLTPESERWKLVLMMAHVTLISLVYQTGLVFVGNAVAVRFSRFESAQVFTRRLVGLSLIGFGARLALNRK